MCQVAAKFIPKLNTQNQHQIQVSDKLVLLENNYENVLKHYYESQYISLCLWRRNKSSIFTKHIAFFNINFHEPKIARIKKLNKSVNPVYFSLNRSRIYPKTIAVFTVESENVLLPTASSYDAAFSHYLQSLGNFWSPRVPLRWIQLLGSQGWLHRWLQRRDVGFRC